MQTSTTPEGYRTTPDQNNTGWPPGVPYIIGNELCERFSFYGMRSILRSHLFALFTTFYTAQAVMSQSEVAEQAKASATAVVHLFFAGVYALPMIGALLADRLLGKYRTILYLSLVYCAGHAVLARYEDSLTGMYVGLALIAIGSGGIKPCVSANVGDQFGEANWHKVRYVFQIFYFSINLGSALATLAIPVVKRHFGPGYAFGLPGVLMFLATVIFWLGRRKYVHVPPKPGGRIGLLDALSSICLFLAIGHLFFTPGLLQARGTGVAVAGSIAISAAFLVLGLWLFAYRQRLQPDDGFLAVTLHALRNWLSGEREASRPEDRRDEPGGSLARSRFWGPAVERFGVEATEGPVAVFKIVSVFVFVAMFWAVYDQKVTTWAFQAERMELRLWPGSGPTIEADQTIAINPFLVMLLIPLLDVAYRGLGRLGITVSPLRRMAVGMFIAALAFVATAAVQTAIDRLGPGRVWIGWQLPQYLLLTTAEVMVSITGLEFAYTQAPRRMKSTVMGFWLLTSAAGNVLVVLLLPLLPDSRKPEYLLAWAGLMAVTALLFVARAAFYVPRDYAQK